MFTFVKDGCSESLVGLEPIAAKLVLALNTCGSAKEKCGIKKAG